MALQGFFRPLSVFAAVLVILISTALYRIYLHPLAHIPGPLVARLTSIWLYSLSYRGIEATTVNNLHKRYGPVVQIAPNEVDIADGAALHLVYVKDGGFLKNSCYKNFDINGFPTIFSALDPTHRATRAKAVVAMFSQSALRDGKNVLYGCVDNMVARLKREKADVYGKPVNVLNIFRSLAFEMVTSYLFEEPYHGIEEQKLSATDFVDNFAAIGRFFYLPNTIFKFVEFMAASLDRNKSDILRSNKMVEKFAADAVDKAATLENAKEDTYQARLLKAGISREETIAHCLDVMFAGTDGIGMNLSAICCHLSRDCHKYVAILRTSVPVMTAKLSRYDRLRKEILDNQSADVQTLPYLSGVVKEGLRLGMANPTRLARIVSSNGLKVYGLLSIPAGTSVGLSAYTLHLNPKVFPNPHEFLPERWLEPTPEMLRDSIAFGIGPRQCIARNLAVSGLFWAVEGLVKSDVLRGARPVRDRIEILEWFNARVKDKKIELVW